MTTAFSEGHVRLSLGMPQLPAPDYPAEVRDRLEADAEEVIARYPDSRGPRCCRCCTSSSREEGFVSAHRHPVLRRGAGPDHAPRSPRWPPSTRCTGASPRGDYQVGVCTNTLCAVMGGDAIFDELKEHLGVGNDETTADGKVTLEHIECNAACDYAPVVMVNWEFFDNQTAESAKRHGRRPARRPSGRADPGRAAVHVQGDRPDPGRLPRRARGRGGGERRRRSRLTGRPAHRARRVAAARQGRAPARRERRPRRGSDDGDRCDARERHQPGEAAGTRTVGVLGRAGVVDAGDLPAARGLRGPAQGARHDTGRPHRLREGLRSARARRRGLPHRNEVAVHPAGRRKAALPRRERGRVGAGNLQGHPPPLRQPALPHRGNDHRLLRDPLGARLHLPARRGRAGTAAPARGGARGVRGRLPRGERPRAAG